MTVTSRSVDGSGSSGSEFEIFLLQFWSRIVGASGSKDRSRCDFLSRGTNLDLSSNLDVLSDSNRRDETAEMRRMISSVCLRRLNIGILTLGESWPSSNPAKDLEKARRLAPLPNQVLQTPSSMHSDSRRSQRASPSPCWLGFLVEQFGRSLDGSTTPRSELGF